MAPICAQRTTPAERERAWSFEAADLQRGGAPPLPYLPTSAPGLGSPLPHLHRDWSPCHICTGLGSPLPHLHRDWSPCHIGTGTGLASPSLHPRPHHHHALPSTSSSNRARDRPHTCTPATPSHWLVADSSDHGDVPAQDAQVLNGPVVPPARRPCHARSVTARIRVLDGPLMSFPAAAAAAASAAAALVCRSRTREAICRTLQWTRIVRARRSRSTPTAGAALRLAWHAHCCVRLHSPLRRSRWWWVCVCARARVRARVCVWWLAYVAVAAELEHTRT